MSAALIRKPCCSRWMATQPLARPVKQPAQALGASADRADAAGGAEGLAQLDEHAAQRLCTIISAKFTASTSQSMAA